MLFLFLTTVLTWDVFFNDGLFDIFFLVLVWVDARVHLLNHNWLVDRAESILGGSSPNHQVGTQRRLLLLLRAPGLGSGLEILFNLASVEVPVATTLFLEVVLSKIMMATHEQEVVVGVATA